MEDNQRCVIPRHSGRKPWAQAGLVVCTEHMAELRDLLSDIRDGWEALPYSGLPLASVGDRQGVRGKRADPPAPVNLAALALQAPQARAKSWPTITRERNGDRLESNGADAPDIAAVLAAWCAEVADERHGIAEPSALDQWLISSNAITVPGMIGALRKHLSWIAGQSWLVEFDREMRDCRRWLALAVPLDNMPAPYCACPYCGVSLWTDRDQDIIKRRRYGQDVTEATGRTDRVACQTCRRVWQGTNELARLLLTVRDDQNRRAAAREAG